MYIHTYKLTTCIVQLNLILVKRPYCKFTTYYVYGYAYGCMQSKHVQPCAPYRMAGFLVDNNAIMLAK